MSKNQPVKGKGQHGIGAKGQGKMTFFQTGIAEALRRSKSRLHPKSHAQAEFRTANGHWV
jgi:hypothetical protein